MSSKIPKFTISDVACIRTLVTDHFDECDNQTVSCHGCYVFIEYFKNAPLYSYDEVYGS